MLAAGFCAASLAQVLVEPIAGRVVSVVVAVWSTAPLAWRRSYPVPAALVGSAAWLTPTFGYLYLGFVVAALLWFEVGVRVAVLERLAAVVAVGAALAVVAVVLSEQHRSVVFGAGLAVVGPAVAGRLVARSRAQSMRLRELSGELVRERAAAEQAAIAQERTRIARELHDVIGHEVTVIALQADAAAAALDRAPARAAAPVATIRQAAAEALEEMRRLVSLLREPGDDEELQPQPGLADLPALVDGARAGGAQVDLRLRLPLVPPPPGVQLAVYRIVQEALTNARRHAPGAAARVGVEGDGAMLCVEVVNTGGRAVRAAGGGHGLIGMQERVRMHGGDLEARPTADGFVVRARVPHGAP